MELQSKNPAFSLRAFAKRLGVSPSTISMVLSGNRTVSVRLARRLCDRLLLDPTERNSILKQFPDRGHYKNQNREGISGGAVLGSVLKLSSDQFRLMSEWYYFAILSLIKTHDFRSDPVWIAKRLGIASKKARNAIEVMRRLGILAVNSEGALIRTAQQIRTTDDVADVSLRKSHYQSLELARESLERDPIDLRDLTYLTLPVDPSVLPEAKQRIREFLREMDEFLTSRSLSLSEVYRVGVQFFPLTKLKVECANEV